MIESGTDFERRVFEIHQSARNEDEVNAEFDRLQAELDESIKADVLDARGKLLGFFDQDVVRILKSRKKTIERVMGEFEERLITVARAELPDANFYKHTDGSPCFEHDGETWTTGWPLADEQKWKFFRLADGNLASRLAANAKGRMLPLASLTFDYSAYQNGVLANVKQHIGRSGWLRVSRFAVRTASQTVEHLLTSAVTDDGAILDDDVIDRLFLVPAAASTVLGLTPPRTRSTRPKPPRVSAVLDEADHANAEYLAKETDKLDNYADDLEKAADAEIKAVEDEIKTKRKELRMTRDFQWRTRLSGSAPSRSWMASATN